MSEFTERLRLRASDAHDALLMDEAADIIDSLESVVTDFQSYGCPICNGDCGSANPPVYNCPMTNARDVLNCLRSLK